MRKDGENFQTESMVRDEKVEEKRDDELVSLPRMYSRFLHENISFSKGVPY